MERLDKVLSHHGWGTRKDVKKLLRTSLVTLNGKRITDPSVHIDVEKDILCVDDETVKLQRDLYIMMNKCKDVVCANKDGEHATVFDLIDESLRHKFLGGDLHTMGRLDIDTEGLLILTTDGKLTHRMLNPKTHAPKTYAVTLRDKLTDEQKNEYIQKFSKGFFIDREQNESGFDCQPAKLIWMDSGNIKGVAAKNAEGTDCILTITEGKFHQVKRMFSAQGNEVTYLKRIKMGDLDLDPLLETGKYRELTNDEIEVLINSSPMEE